MTVIELRIPDDMEPALQQVPGDKQLFILDAVRQQLSDMMQATDTDIELATTHDLGDDFLNHSELAYYLALPNVPTS